MNRLVLTLALVAAPAALTPQQRTEIRRVEDRLLAPCCYSQSVAEHMSPVAEQMRQEITEMVTAGESEPAIINHYKTMYGERILIIPSGETGRILFTLPALGVVLGAALLFLFLRGALKRKVNAAAASANAAPDRSRQVFREQFDRLDEDI